MRGRYTTTRYLPLIFCLYYLFFLKTIAVRAGI